MFHQIRRITMVLVGAVLGASLVGAPPASAAEPTEAAAAPRCGVNRQENTIVTGFREPGTVIRKAPRSVTGCAHLYIAKAFNTSPRIYDLYAGMYYKVSEGAWKTGTRGYVRYDDGWINPWGVLLSDVLDGTQMSVASWEAGGDIVIVTH